MNPADIHGRRLAMIAWGTKPDGSDDVVVFTGIADWDGKRLTMLRQPPSESFPIPDEWLDRVKPTPPNLKVTLLDAEYSFSVTVGALPDGTSAGEHLKTTLKWPTDVDEK